MRYEDVDSNVLDLFGKVRSKYFENLEDVGFKLVYDTKKRIKNGKYVFASIKTVDDLTDFLAEDDFNYVITIDKNIWEKIEEGDRIRVLRRMLRSVEVDHAAKNKYKIKPFDREDFEEEIRLASEESEPNWIQKLSVMAEIIYNDNEGNQQ